MFLLDLSASLTGISVSEGNGLKPSFNYTLLNYRTTVENNVTQLNFQASLYNLSTNLSFLTVPLVSGVYTTVNLSVGSNVFTLKVTSHEGTTNYKLTITRKPCKYEG